MIDVDDEFYNCLHTIMEAIFKYYMIFQFFLHMILLALVKNYNDVIFG